MPAEEFDAEACFGPEGRLAAQVADYRPRREQQAMAAAVWDALEQQRALAVEAGTGVGKTLAYLMPVLAAGHKTLIATATRHLQDQLFQKDLPDAYAAAGRELQACVLKGRANYLCLHRYRTYAGDDFFGRSKRSEALNAWAAQTDTGDLAELDFPEDDALAPAITSTAENCLGKDCGDFKECFVMRARERARSASIVIANHHLFAADLVMREDALGECLPAFEALVFDEAHKLRQALEQSWSRRTSTAKVAQFCNDVEKFSRSETGMDTRVLGVHVRSVRQALKQVIGQTYAELAKERQARVRRIPPPPPFKAWIRPLLEALAELQGDFKAYEGEDPMLENLAAQCGRLLEALGDWPKDETGWCEYLCFTEQATRKRFLSQGFSLHQTPLDISGAFAEARTRYPARWIYTSATLSVGGNFDFFKQKLGLAPDTASLLLHSPFFFQDQAVLYLPQGLPNPNQPHYTEAMLQSVLPLLEAMQGRTLLLFTSLRAMREAREWLAAKLDCDVLMQGEAPRWRLLERFAKGGARMALLGSMSFWEGVDIRGPALSCVVIDKIPFENHTDLLHQARRDAIREGGGDPFAQWQLPHAALLLKQGIGRLLRSETDQGVAVIADPRIGTKGYGEVLLESLPDLAIRKDPDQVLRFVRGMAA